MTGGQMWAKLVLSALLDNQSVNFKRRRRGATPKIHATNPRYDGATTVENRRTNPRPGTRSNRRCEEKHTIYFTVVHRAHHVQSNLFVGTRQPY